MYEKVLCIEKKWWYLYAKMRSAMCYLQKIRCYVICKMTISCYVLCEIKWLLLCAMCGKMASAMCYVKPLEGPQLSAQSDTSTIWSKDQNPINIYNKNWYDSWTIWTAYIAYNPYESNSSGNRIGCQIIAVNHKTQRENENHHIL